MAFAYKMKDLASHKNPAVPAINNHEVEPAVM
jgi:hypothetical protein